MEYKVDYSICDEGWSGLNIKFVWSNAFEKGGHSNTMVELSEIASNKCSADVVAIVVTVVMSLAWHLSVLRLVLWTYLCELFTSIFFVLSLSFKFSWMYI